MRVNSCSTKLRDYCLAIVISMIGFLMCSSVSAQRACNCTYNDDFGHNLINLTDLVTENHCTTQREMEILDSERDGEFCTCIFHEDNPLTGVNQQMPMEYGEVYGRKLLPLVLDFVRTTLNAYRLEINFDKPEIKEK